MFVIISSKSNVNKFNHLSSKTEIFNFLQKYIAGKSAREDRTFLPSERHSDSVTVSV